MIYHVESWYILINQPLNNYTTTGKDVRQISG